MSAPALELPTLEVNVPRYEPGRATVLSIWPFDQKHPTYHAGMVTYWHPKCEPDKIKVVQMNPMRMCMVPSNPVKPEDLWMAKYTEQPCQPGKGYVRIDVVDTYTRIRDRYAEGVEDNAPILFRDAMIPANAVANMLVDTFSGGRTGDDVYGGAGIKVYDPRQTLEQQLADLDRMQRELAGGLYDKAEEFALNRQFTNITNYHRTLAQWAQLPHRDWMRVDRNARKEMKTCPNCQEAIPAACIICTKCHVNLVQLAEEYGVGKSDEAVQMILALKKKSTEAKVEAKVK